MSTSVQPTEANRRDAERLYDALCTIEEDRVVLGVDSVHGNVVINLEGPFLEVIRAVLVAFRNGDPVVVEALPDIIPVADIARVLHVDYTYVTRLLEDGRLPSAGPGRARTTDVFAHREARNKKRREALDALQQETIEILGLNKPTPTTEPA